MTNTGSDPGSTMHEYLSKMVAGAYYAKKNGSVKIASVR